MPDIHTDGPEYSSVTGIIFLFNLIVGTGALALPSAFQKAGWLLGVGLILILSFFSFVTVTFIVESLAVANALSKRQHAEQEETPLVPRADGQEISVFEITEKLEIGEMGVLMSPKWCQIIIYMCVCVYLFGDLSIYAVVVGKTFSHVICDHPPNSKVEEESKDDLCFGPHGMTRNTVYRLSVLGFICAITPFLFANLQKTKLLQMLTGVLRWLAFFVMITWSVTTLIIQGNHPTPIAMEITALPTLFGTLVYSFMCQHSLPGVLQPISTKHHISRIIPIDFLLIVMFYILLSLTAIFTFEHVEDIYTLNFWSQIDKPNTSTFVKIVSYYLAMFPLFTLSTSFPIIGITLKNNLRAMMLRTSPVVWYFDRLLFPIITIIPPAILALSVSDVQLLVGVIGSYAGTCVQYLIPCLLVVFARSQAICFNGVNKYESPFKSKFWLYLVYVWMGVSLVLISINYLSDNVKAIPLQ